MSPRFSIQTGLGLLLLAHAMMAQGQQADRAAVDAAVNMGNAGPVLLELLEFIGEFTTEDGEWVDPSALLEAADDELAGDSDAPVLGAVNDAVNEEQPAAPVENCRVQRCE
jgi:uncharacterized protein HemY